MTALTAETEPAPLGGRAAAVPGGIRIYAVGDVHGRLDLLRQIEALIVDDMRSAPDARVVQVMLGDYVDRGPDSRGVIAHLAAGVAGRERVALRGNHEAYILEAPTNPLALVNWCRFGGRQTFASYGVDIAGIDDDAMRTACADAARRFLGALPADHAAFLARTRLRWRCGDYLFVHAGLRPGVALANQAEHDMIWIRGEFLESEADFGCVVVHGHTPGPAPVIRPNRIGIDTRAYESGILTCLVLEGESRRFLATG